MGRAALTIGTGKSSGRVAAAVDVAASPTAPRPSRSQAAELALEGILASPRIVG